MCDQIQNSPGGTIEDAYWKKIVNKMYDRDDLKSSRYM